MEVRVMKNHQRYKNTIQAKRNKARFARLANSAAQHKAGMTSHQIENLPGWFAQRKRFAQRLRSLGGGHLVLAESYPFGGSRERNWVQDARCEHVFLVSGRQLLELGTDACPFCHTPDDLQRCGSVGAVAEMVKNLSYGNIEFLSNNALRGPDDLYHFACLIHRFRFEATYRDFIRDPENFCHICKFHRGKK
jgi:hypothetical protein